MYRLLFNLVDDGQLFNEFFENEEVAAAAAAALVLHGFAVSIDEVEYDETPNDVEGFDEYDMQQMLTYYLNYTAPSIH